MTIKSDTKEKLSAGTRKGKGNIENEQVMRRTGKTMEDNRYKRAWGNESENVSVRKSAVSVRRKKCSVYMKYSV